MNLKSTKITYWISTGLIALFILPGIFFLTSPQATEGIKHLGLPLWFHYELGIGKFIGGLIILIPFFPKRIKEWAYVALGIDMLSAVIGLASVDGFVPMSFAPLVTFAILLVSYISFHKLQNAQKNK
ncbi:hypothetical protein GALL_220340 [mine drainage metagenome]|uniref:DoxX-like family protein n=1 Tax=mine drainage metagenome TaxID=410659 RepID=A0A1J5S2N8_9ZZZZ